MPKLVAFFPARILEYSPLEFQNPFFGVAMALKCNLRAKGAK
ncbi:Hypothetical protein Bdt_1427 [Bdellovibrio bacteriovorus str. Tiberius]|uniref:Uncharacterized protein n=1 Tax=Bdellovibrio bacteriovorus str. Tiberius TaxID=1069642 RepID=K7YWM9_BDEBC|nr:Hypothetical protein Bdt_1427 [Bdellovibrio bacteriovorus str. Tiberius]